MSSCEVPVIAVGINKTSIFRQISEKFQISLFIKIRLMGAELFHANRQKGRQADGRTGKHDEANNRLSQFCERTLNKVEYWHL
jgi:hypothetical protein